MNPKVSIIVPCYKLAHFLAECVDSILAQTFTDFEILIMDDCSPDNTREVAAKYTDPRVIYIRNEPNFGNIRNYNKGIDLTRGQYVWLISADDRLRSREILKKYVDLLDRHSNLGYVFCPAMSLKDGVEAGVDEWTAWAGKQDRILTSQEVIKRAATFCPVCAPTGLVRKECYTQMSVFPTSLPRTGDYYLWSLFATKYDVGYFAEPMVYYRKHDSNMDTTSERDMPAEFFAERLRALWVVKNEAEKAGFKNVMPEFQRNLADSYLLRLAKKKVENWAGGCTWEAATTEIKANASSAEESEIILQLMRKEWPKALADSYAFEGSIRYSSGQLNQAVAAFQSALSSNPWSVKPRVYLLASRLEELFGLRLLLWIKSLNRLKIF
jgi:glycosyltransferase involved in cell wall biosynthesis